MSENLEHTIANDAFRLSVSLMGEEIRVLLRDLATDFAFAEGPHVYRLCRGSEEGSLVARGLRKPAIENRGESITIRGTIGGFTLEQSFMLPAGKPHMEERIKLTNISGAEVELESFRACMQRQVAEEADRVLDPLATDILLAVPFRHKPEDPPGIVREYRFSDLLSRAGRQQREGVGGWRQYGYVPSTQWQSEGWAWTRRASGARADAALAIPGETGERTLGVFKFNQDFVEWSVLTAEAIGEGVSLCFGGASLSEERASGARKVEAGATIEFGVTRYVSVKGGHTQACYAFRAFLDERGCRFPKGFNPPVHWNELYDNPEWQVGTPGTPPGRRMTRPVTYTRELIEEEAAKAKEYGCQALYLDPGWDTDFGTFLWGEEWLGARKELIATLHERYGLELSLHCPLASWMSVDGRGVSSWPRQAMQMDEQGNIREGRICLGSKQYLQEAARRLNEHCADGAVYLMFDGNRWQGTCWNPDHGHPVPNTVEDHCRANVELARMIHNKHPKVLIEMHDMIASGSDVRYTPVYYKYGLPGSYDENWGFELMWEPIEDLRSGRASGLYYYNLGCNVPVYLHIDLRDDNEHCLVFWWYASTCRHLGIGGTHPEAAVAQAQKAAMARYRKLERFYKEGEFYGLGEGVHIHALAGEHAFVVNLFNPSDEYRLVSGSIPVEEMGIARNRWYVRPKGGRFDRDKGVFTIRRLMPPWSAEVAEVWPVADYSQPVSRARSPT